MYQAPDVWTSTGPIKGPRFNGMGLLIPNSAHQIASAAITYANYAISKDDPTMMQNAKVKLDKAAKDLEVWTSGSEYQKNVALLAASFNEVVAQLSPTAQAPIQPSGTVTTSGAVIDDMDDIFSMRDKPGSFEEEEEIRERQQPPPAKSLWDIISGAASKIVAPPDQPLSTEFPETYTTSIREEVANLSPEERPEYDAAIAAGLNPDVALDKVKTNSFARQVAQSSDPSSTLTNPSKGSVQQPWLNIKDIGSVVGALLQGWSSVEQSKLTAKIMAQQNKGKRIQLPWRPAREIKRKVPWLAISLGAVGFVAVGLLVFLMARRS